MLQLVDVPLGRGSIKIDRVTSPDVFLLQFRVLHSPVSPCTLISNQILITGINNKDQAPSDGKSSEGIS